MSIAPNGIPEDPFGGLRLTFDHLGVINGPLFNGIPEDPFGGLRPLANTLFLFTVIG